MGALGALTKHDCFPVGNNALCKELYTRPSNGGWCIVSFAVTIHENDTNTCKIEQAKVTSFVFTYQWREGLI